jgi:hypothetical protein
MWAIEVKAKPCSSNASDVKEEHHPQNLTHRVGNHGDHSVGPLRIIVHLKLCVPPRLHQRRLRGLNFVGLVVRVLVNRVGLGEKRDDEEKYTK